ncbi:MAG: CPBP family intramembrane metalloprotease [Candidatus Hydrogenedentes bacterium]|nr:CPBP family intramembrane metalloprotease [Candidatus Hydrogenedentota bacterium]
MGRYSTISTDTLEHTLTDEPQPWGFWATLGFGLLAALLMIFSQIVVGVVYIFLRLGGDSETDFEQLAMGLEFDGLYMALAGIVSTPVLVGSVFVLTALRRGFPSREYLALSPINFKVMYPWLALAACYMVGTEVYAYVFDVADSSAIEFMTRVRDTAVYPVLLFIAIVLCAPVSEEIFFRGFMFKGFQNSRLGTSGAIVFTAVLWAAIHVQYELYLLIVIFGFGIILGLARQRTGSLFTTIVLHMLWNLAATVQVEYFY